MNVGDVVEIYQDPVTKTGLEGEAVIHKILSYYEGIYRLLVVFYNEDDRKYERTVYVEDEDEHPFPEPDKIRGRTLTDRESDILTGWQDVIKAQVDKSTMGAVLNSVFSAMCLPFEILGVSEEEKGTIEMIPKNIKGSDLIGRKAHPVTTLINGAGQAVSPDSVVTITGVVKGYGLNVQSEKCPCCGQFAYMRRIPRELLNLIDPE